MNNAEVIHAAFTKSNIRISKHFLSFCLLLLLVGQSILAAEPLNLRVVWSENPQTQAAVLWDSIGNGNGVLLVREGSATKTHEASVSKYSTDIKGPNKGKETSPDAPPMLTDCYLVKLTGLKPSTKYFLTAKVGDDQGKEYYFVTAPDKDIDFKIFAAGDSRTHIDKTCAVSEIIRKAFEEDPSYLALVHGGGLYQGFKDFRVYRLAKCIFSDNDFGRAAAANHPCLGEP